MNEDFGHRDFVSWLWGVFGISLWVLLMLAFFGWIGLAILAGWLAVGAVVGVTVGRWFEEEE